MTFEKFCKNNEYHLGTVTSKVHILEYWTINTNLRTSSYLKKHENDSILLKKHSSRSPTLQLWEMIKNKFGILKINILDMLLSLVRSSLPDHGLNLCPQHWKHTVLTTGLSGNSIIKLFLYKQLLINYSDSKTFFSTKLFIFWPCCIACGILVPQPWIEPAPPAWKVSSLNRWTTREAPQHKLLSSFANQIYYAHMFSTALGLWFIDTHLF